MTLILKLDLAMVKMYLHTKNEVSMSRGSKVIAWTDRNLPTYLFSGNDVGHFLVSSGQWQILIDEKSNFILSRN